MFIYSRVKSGAAVMFGQNTATSNNVTNKLVRDLLPGRNYHFKIVATNAYGNSPDSAVISIATASGILLFCFNSMFRLFIFIIYYIYFLM